MDRESLVQRLFNLAEPFLAVRGDQPHARVSHQYALRLLEAEGGEAGIVEPAVILHDVGWSKLSPPEIKIAFGVRAGGEEAERLNRVHEEEGAAIARRILGSLDYPSDWVERITRIIERHDSGAEADTLEEKIVKDADKLWRFSPVGYWQEIERQGLDSDELFRFLRNRYAGWFFTRKAEQLAEEELKERAKEIAAGGRYGPADDNP